MSCYFNDVTHSLMHMLLYVHMYIYKKNTVCTVRMPELQCHK